MNKSTPTNDYGISGLVESYPRLAIKDVIPISYHAWQQRLLSEGAIEINRATISLVASTLSGGGKRFWFVCPQCGRRCGVLHSQPINGTIGCRICLRLKYKKNRFKGMIEGENLSKNENEYENERNRKNNSHD